MELVIVLAIVFCIMIAVVGQMISHTVLSRRRKSARARADCPECGQKRGGGQRAI